MNIEKYIKNGYEWVLVKKHEINKDLFIGMYYNKLSNSYEVVTIKRNKDFGTIRIIQNKEILSTNEWLFPTNEDFGSTGFSYIQLENAENKYKELIEVSFLP